MSDDLGRPDEPRERSTYSSFDDNYRGFDAREEESGGKSLLVIGLAAGVVLVFGTVVWNAYRTGVKKDANDTPIIRADAQDYKKRPDEQGGFKVPNQDKRLFDAIDNHDRSKTPVTPVNADGDEQVQISDGKPDDLRPGRVTDKSDTVVTPTPSPTPTARPTARPTPTPTPTLLPSPKPTPQRTIVEPVTPKFTVDQSGQYVVQIMALRDLGTAEKAWSQLVEANADLFAGTVMDVQRADLGARGIFYRLRASAFPTRDDADKFCEELKSRKQSCIVATRS